MITDSCDLQRSANRYADSTKHYPGTAKQSRKKFHQTTYLPFCPSLYKGAKNLGQKKLFLHPLQSMVIINLNMMMKFPLRESNVKSICTERELVGRSMVLISLGLA